MSHAVRGTTRPRAILIAGPTASGKSGLALRLARRLGGRVINADSMQVYGDLSILTARPSTADMAEAPHALYGTVDGAETYAVSRWLVDAEAEILHAEAEGTLPILVGGTGLYFKALTQGLSDIPPVPAGVRAGVRAWANGKTPEVLHAELSRRDPATAARLRPSDPQRLLRALEVHAATGESLVALQGRRMRPLLEPDDVRAVALSIDRAVLRARIDARFDTMMAMGALDEIARLAARRLDPALPVMRAIGVPPLLRHLQGEVALEDAVTAAKTASRQYIKRQETFAQHQLPTFRSIGAEDAEGMLLSSFQSSA